MKECVVPEVKNPSRVIGMILAMRERGQGVPRGVERYEAVIKKVDGTIGRRVPHEARVERAGIDVDSDAHKIPLPLGAREQNGNSEKKSAQWSQDESRREILTVFEQIFGDRLELHVGRSLVNRADLGVAPEFLDREVLAVAIAAIMLDGLRRYPFCDLR